MPLLLDCLFAWPPFLAKVPAEHDSVERQPPYRSCDANNPGLRVQAYKIFNPVIQYRPLRTQVLSFPYTMKFYEYLMLHIDFYIRRLKITGTNKAESCWYRNNSVDTYQDRTGVN